MVEPFKNLLNPALVRASSLALMRAWPKFDRERFERVALEGLDDLEMKARAMQIAEAAGQRGQPTSPALGSAIEDADRRPAADPAHPDGAA